jgi:hypothetical protein
MLRLVVRENVISIDKGDIEKYESTRVEYKCKDAFLRLMFDEYANYVESDRERDGD